jgi:hypothetical protein
MRKTILTGIPAAAALLLVPSMLFGQLTARGLGMGGAYTALARGVHAPDWNPANLGLPDNPSFSLTLVSAGIGIENNSATLDLYNHYAVDSYWDPDEVANLLDQIPDDGLEADVSASARVFSFSAGHFALTLGLDAGGNARLDKTFFNIPLAGTRLNTVYSFGNTRAAALGIARVGLSFGKPVDVDFAKAFALGGTVHFDGGGYGRSEKVEALLSTKDYGIDLDGGYDARYGLCMNALGFDAGLAAQMNDRWTLSLGIKNLIGSMHWNKEVEEAFGYFRGDSIDALNIGDIEKDDSTGSYMKNSPYVDSSWTVEGKSFSTRLPVEIRAGAAYRDGDVALTIDYAQGFEDGPWTTTRPRIAIGTEWRKIGWLPLRMGVAVGGRTGIGTSVGFGLRLGSFCLDWGLLNRGFLLPKTTKGLVMAFEMGFGLPK